MAPVKVQFATLCILLSLLLLATVATCHDQAEADHQVYLPLVPNTPLMQEIIRTQEYLWCADARASAYPQFLTQLRDVNDRYFERTGIRHREVAFSDPACQVKHTMPDNHGCSSCAAWIFYANWPVVIEYKWQLGYVDWRSTHGHELGHGLLGLHEQYRDSGGNIGCTGRQDTVMDCGGNPQVRYPQPLDVQRGCAIITTSWCDQVPPPCDPCWDGTRWRFSDGRSFAPNSGCGEWYSAKNTLEWGACDDSWGGRFFAPGNVWHGRTCNCAYSPTTNEWFSLVIP